MSRPRSKTVKKETIARYQRLARSGSKFGKERLKSLGIRVKKARSVGRPFKEFSNLSLRTQRLYAKRIVRNVRELQTIDKSYETNQPYRKILSSAEVYGILDSKVYGNKTANIYYKQFRQYSKKNAVKERMSEIVNEYKDKENIDLSGLTESEQREYYESKYFVLTESNEYDSEGLKMYFEEHNETVSQTRFRDFITDVLMARYPKGSDDYIRVEKIRDSI